MQSPGLANEKLLVEDSADDTQATTKRDFERRTNRGQSLLNRKRRSLLFLYGNLLFNGNYGVRCELFIGG